jgi:magnesium-transporting ATPase (P-type)
MITGDHLETALKVAIDAAMAEELKKQQAEAQRRNAEKKAKAEAAKLEAAKAAEEAANAE